MALSFHPNLDCLTTTIFPETQTEMAAAAAAAAPELFNFYGNGNFNFHFCDTYTNPLFEADYHDDQLFHSDTYCTNYHNSNNMISLSPEIPLEEEFEPYSYDNPNKRQKISSFVPALLSPVMVPEFLPEIQAPEVVPKFDAPAAVVTVIGRSESGKKGVGGGGRVSLSAQSMAARERRRKITEKTQELGKLVPGGSKMNTAEMFQAASKYVKFLQAQVGLLELMASMFPESKEVFNTHELLSLLASPTIQEKLYSEEKCLVPRDFIQTLANEPEIQSKSLILDDIHHLLATNM